MPLPPDRQHPHDILAARLDEQWATIVFLRWLAAVFFGIVVIVGTAETAILWSISHNVAVLQSAPPIAPTLEVMRHTDEEMAHDIAALQAGTIDRAAHDALVNRVETISDRLGIVQTTQTEVLRRLDALEAREYGNDREKH